MISMMGSSNPSRADYASAPDSLVDQCSLCIVKNLSSICYTNETTGLYELHPGVVLPRELCEKLFQLYCQCVGFSDNKFFNIFSNASVTSLQKVCLRNSKVSDNGLRVLLEHKLVDLELESCLNLTTESFSVLNNHGENLLFLAIGKEVELLPSPTNCIPVIAVPGCSSVVPGIQDSEHFVSPVLNTPKLKRLTIRNLVYEFGLTESIYFNKLFENLHNLTHLDLSGCLKIQYFSFLPNLKNLVFLVLHNVAQVQDGLPSICQMKNLR